MRVGAGSNNVRNKFMSSLLEHIIHKTDRATKSGALQTIPTNVVELLEKETGIKVRSNAIEKEQLLSPPHLASSKCICFFF